MIELKFGQLIDMEFGGKAKVLKKIGSGGQGSVYLVEFNGMRNVLVTKRDVEELAATFKVMLDL